MRLINGGTAGRILTGLAAAGLAAYAYKKASGPKAMIATGVASALLGSHAASGGWTTSRAVKLVAEKPDHSAIDRMGIRVEESITIDAPVAKVYEFWNNVENFPQFMNHLRSVEKTGPKTSHWVSDAPLGTSVSWDAEETKNVANDVIAWQSTSGSVPNAGSVRFTARGQKTRVRVKMGYTPPAGTVGATVAGFFGEDPKSQLKEYLAKVKNLLEA